MSPPTIGVVIATPGRRSILRTISSIQHQGLLPGDDVLVVGDGYHAPTADIIAAVGAPFRYVATTKTRDWGHSQANYGLKHVRGDWVVMQDDDDVFLPRAFDEMRAIISKLESPRPIIGRVMTPYLGILWREPRQEPLDGHCLVVPNDKDKLGYFGLEYAGDQKWLASNLEAYDTYSWADRVWSLTRPTAKMWPLLFRHVPYSVFEWTFHRDDEGVPADALSVHLIMHRAPLEEHWRAQMTTRGTVTQEEVQEVAEFAAWAGQGSDTWFAIGNGDVTAIRALVAAGYKLHRATEYYLEYVFDWPPKKFEPPKQEET